MSWFYISLLGTSLFAAGNFIDKILISKYFKGGGVGALAIYSAFIGFFLLPLPIFFDLNYFDIPFTDIGIMMASGVVYLVGIIAYLYAMTKDDTSSVVPLFQTIPIFAFILGYFFLNEIISALQFTGILLIILGSMFLSIDLAEKKIRFKYDVVALMLISSFFIALSNFLFKVGGVDYGFIVTSFWAYMGYAILGVVLFIFLKSYRREFLTSVRENKAFVLGINTLNEVIAIAGKMLQNLATLMAPLALAIAVNGFQPLLVLIYGVLLTIFVPNLIKENVNKKHLAYKFVCIIVLMSGAFMIN